MSLMGVDQWPSAAVTAAAGLAGVVIGALLTASLAAFRDRKQRRLAFIEKQLKEFYSPMLGLRAEVRALSELRVKLQGVAGELWSDLCDSVEPGPALQELAANRSAEFTALIDHDNSQLSDRLMPAYRKMLELFRERLWLAEDETQMYYPALVEFVDVWERWLGGSLPGELIRRIAHSEANLHPFYEHLEVLYARLRSNFAQR